MSKEHACIAHATYHLGPSGQISTVATSVPGTYHTSTCVWNDGKCTRILHVLLARMLQGTTVSRREKDTPTKNKRCAIPTEDNIATLLTHQILI